jgi:hypothetical protein
MGFRPGSLELFRQPRTAIFLTFRNHEVVIEKPFQDLDEPFGLLGLNGHDLSGTLVLALGLMCAEIPDLAHHVEVLAKARWQATVFDDKVNLVDEAPGLAAPSFRRSD